jgi:hypothetical protein
VKTTGTRNSLNAGTMALTPTQQRYFQLEKELLALQFGRFKQYIFVQQITVEWDHKPLVVG